MAPAAIGSRGADRELSPAHVHRPQRARARAERPGRSARRHLVRASRTTRAGGVSEVRARLSERLGEPGAGVAAQVLPARFRRAAVRPDSGHREGGRVAGVADRAELRRHRVAAPHPVRAAPADVRGHRDRPRGAGRGASPAQGRNRRRDRARALRRPPVAGRYRAQGPLPAVHADGAGPPHRFSRGPSRTSGRWTARCASASRSGRVPGEHCSRTS